MAKVLGIDVGGSGIKGAIVDTETGTLVTDRHRVPTPENSSPDEVKKIIDAICEHFSWKGLIGVGFPSLLHKGVALTAANINEGWVGKNVAELFSKETGNPVFAINDADAAGIAEMRFGVGKNYIEGVVLVLTVGTGIGSAFFVDGHLFPNTELGHIQIRGKDAEHRASDAVRQRKELSWKEWAERFQEYLETLEAILPMDVVIIGGGSSKRADKFMQYLHLRAKILASEMQNESGMIGAAMYAIEQYKPE